MSFPYRRQRELRVDPSLLDSWESIPSQQGLTPDEDLLAPWDEIEQPQAPPQPTMPTTPSSVEAQADEGVAPSPGGQFARQEREPLRVLPYSQRTLTELEHGLAGLRLPQTPQEITAMAAVGSVADVPVATWQRLAKEAEEEGIARGLIKPKAPAPDAGVGERMEHYFPGQVPSTQEMSRQFVPGELPTGWEPVLRDVLAGKYYPPEEIDHIVELTRQGKIPMLSTTRNVPEWAAPMSVKDTLSGMKVLAKGLLYLPPQVAASLVKSLQGERGAGIHNKGRYHKLIEYAHKDLDGFAERMAKEYENKRFLPGIPIREVAQLPRNLSFSIASAGHGVAAGGATALLPVPGARAAAVGVGTAASGIAAFKMASYEFMQNYLELKNEDMLREKGRQITPEEERELKREFAWKARKYGLYEALPEMAGNAMQIGTAFAPLNKMLGKTMATRVMAKMSGMFAEELATESLTEILQSGVEVEAGIPGAEKLDITSPGDWWTAMQRVAPQTALLTLTLGGGAATIGEVTQSLRQEIGEEHPEFEEFIKEIKKRHEEAPGQHEVEMAPDVPPSLEGFPFTEEYRKTEAPLLLPQKTYIAPSETGIIFTSVPQVVSKPAAPKALPVKTATQKLIEETTDVTEFDEPSVRFLLESGMGHEDIRTASDVMRDIIFTDAVSGMTSFTPVKQKSFESTDPYQSSLVASQRDRMIPSEGDSVVMPHMKQAGTLIRWNNDGTGDVAMSSGLRMKVGRSQMIKATGLRVPIRTAQQTMQAPTQKANIPSEFSPVAVADNLIKAVPADKLLSAIAMVGEGNNTPREAIYTMSYGHEQEKLIRALANEIGEEQFIDMMVNRVSEAVAPVADIVEQKRRPVKRATDRASKEFADTPESDPAAPPPWTVPRGEYLIGRQPRLLKRVNTIRDTQRFLIGDTEVIEQYIDAVRKLVARYMPEEAGGFEDIVQRFYAGQASIAELDLQYASFIHRKLAKAQFGDLMEATGLSDPLDAAMSYHRQSVRDALQRGEPIPQEVLEDYPDLTGQAAPVTPELPSLEEQRAANIAAQDERRRQRGQDQPTVGMSVQPVGRETAGLPLPGQERNDFERERARIETENPDVTRAMNAGRDIIDSLRGFKERMAQWSKGFAEILNPELDKELRRQGYRQYVDDKRTGLRTIAAKAQVEAMLDVGAMWGDLNQNERTALMRYIFTRSLLESSKRGLAVPGDLTTEQLQQDYDEQTAAYQQHAPALIDIMERYKIYMNKMSEEMVDRGWLKPDQVMDFYAPHIIVDYTPAYFLEGAYVGRSGRKAFQAYLKKREGSNKDIYAHQEAIISRIATIKADMMFEDWVTGQLEKFDIFPQMSPEARLEHFGKRPSGRLGDPTPHGMYEIDGKVYRGWQYIPGNMVYRDTVVDKSLLAQAFQDAMEDVGLVDGPTGERLIADVADRGFDAIEKYLIGVGPRGGDALRMVRALGARNRTYLIPEEIYNDMKHLTNAGEYSVVTEMMHDARRLISLWKAMTTQIAGGVPFHLRNEFGDVMNVVATAGWEPLSQVPRALKILRNLDNPEALSDFENRVRQIVLDKAVLEAGYFTELSPRSKRSVRLKGDESENPFRTLWNDYQRLSAFRELSNRVAMVAFNLQRMEAGQPIVARGMRGQLEGLDPESQIAYVARNGLIDYGDVPDWYRRRVSGFWFPFATFYQKNMNKWAKMVTAEGGWRMRAMPAALTNVALPVTMLYLWNHYGPNRKTEDALGYRVRKWFHANLWQWDYDEMGNPRKALVYAPDHPVDLALEGVGADALMENIDYVRRGILTPKEAAYKQIADFGMAPLKLGERLLNPVMGYFLDVKANSNAYTGTIVPRGEEDLPEYEKLKHYWFPHLMQRVLTPLSQYMSEEKGDKPPLNIKLMDMPTPKGQDPFEVAFRLPRRPFDVLRGLGFYVIDLDRQTDRDWWQLRRSVGANYARQMRRIQNAYLKSDKDLVEFIASDEAAQLMDETWRKDFAVDYGIAELKQGKMPPRGTLIGYLAGSPTVNIKKLQSRLRQPGLTKEERRNIETSIRSYKEMRRLQDLQRIEEEQMPATFKAIMRRVNKKLEKDSR